jgi:hypothetical protein
VCSLYAVRVFEAAVQDADEAVAELAERCLVAGAAVAQVPGSRGGRVSRAWNRTPTGAERRRVACFGRWRVMWRRHSCVSAYVAIDGLKPRANASCSASVISSSICRSVNFSRSVMVPVTSP